MKKLTVLSYGAGQDSTALLYRYVFDKKFKAKFAPNDFIVIMSDTGDEHPETYKHVERTKKFCHKHNIKFFFLTSDLGFHSDKWLDLRSFYNRTSTVGSKVFFKTCTDNLKLKPIYNFLEHYVSETYGIYGTRKKGLKNFAHLHGKIQMVLGIAKGEEGRMGSDEKAPKWFQKSVERVYPLIDLGMDRKACQDYIRSVGEVVPPPSNCMLCPFMSEQELVWLFRFYPQDFEAWAEIERNKINHYADSGKRNLGVWGKEHKDGSPMLLDDILEIALKKFDSWSDERLQEYKMSHGHCVKTKY